MYKFFLKSLSRSLILRFFSTILMTILSLFIFSFGKQAIFISLSLIFIRGIYEIYCIEKKNFIKIFSLMIFVLGIYFIDIFSGNIFILFFSFLISSLHDMGGYIFGKLFGEKKISPKTSPKKTWEGLFGSIILTGSIMLILKSYILKIFPNYNFLFFPINFIFYVLISFFGDLFFSKIKRNAKVKDFKVIIPGHGGIMDRIDSNIFLAIYINFAFVIKAIFF
jgi:phosphatidate cytidylyltransferase